MAASNVTFSIKELSLGVDPNAAPADRRVRLSYTIYASAAKNVIPPTLADGELVFEIALGKAETDAARFPRIVATTDATPNGDPTGKSHSANLSVKPLATSFQGWIVHAEVPLLFNKAQTTYVSSKLSYKGKQVATTSGRDWKVIPLNPSQSVVRPLSQNRQPFPSLARQICTLRRAVVAYDLAGFNYVEANDDVDRLVYLVEEVQSRLLQGLNAVWTAAEQSSYQATLYDGFSLEEREVYAFGDKKGQGPPILGTLEELQIAVANEAWARAIAEMVCFTPYSSTGIVYYKGEAQTTDSFDSEDEDEDEEIRIRSTLEYELAKGVSGRPHGKDPSYPIVEACQQLTTLAILSRGWYIGTSTAASSGATVDQDMSLNAGSRSAITYTRFLQPQQGTWVGRGMTEGGKPTRTTVDEALLDWLGDTATASPAAASLVKLTDPSGVTAFGPGSVAVFSNGLPATHGREVRRLANPDRTVALKPDEVAAYEQYQAWLKAHPNDTPPASVKKPKPSEVRMIGTRMDDNSGAAHIGCILRVDPIGKRYQVLDTGALNTGSDSAVWGSMPGNRDYPETTNAMSSKYDPFRGIGLAPKLTATTAQQLYDHVCNVLRVARPLGFMRLLVARRNVEMRANNLDEWLLYASPLLRMYGQSATPSYGMNYPMLAWSLRDFPKSDEVKVIWSIRAPRLYLADAMQQEPRETSVMNLVAKAMERIAAAAHRPASTDKERQAQRNAQRELRECVEASDIALTGQAASSSAGDMRAWLIARQMGPTTLAGARLLARFTKLCLDLESNADGTVNAVGCLKAPPAWHQAEEAFRSPAVPKDEERLQIPLFCESSGTWPATDVGSAAWSARRAALRGGPVANGLMNHFFV